VANRAKGPEARTAQPLRTFAQRGIFLLCLAGALTLMVIGRSDPQTLERARIYVTDIAAPILDVIARPFDAAENMVAEGRELLSLREENARLRLEVERLQNWQAVARHLEIENGHLRGLMAYDPVEVSRHITGRVIGVGGTFVRSILLDIGSSDGVRKGQAAMTGAGMIGRVAEVGRNSARVLLMTDLNSRIPIMIEESQARAILAGDNTALPRLIYGAANSDLEPGQRVVTSGDAGAFPPGLPIGVVASADENGVRVQPFVVDERPDLVRLLDFGLDGVLDDRGAPAAE